MVVTVTRIGIPLKGEIFVIGDSVLQKFGPSKFLSFKNSLFVFYDSIKIMHACLIFNMPSG